MPSDLLGLLRLCLLVLLYLFFLRVLRAVWVEVRGPGAALGDTGQVTAAPRRPSRPRRPGRPVGPGATLQVVQPPERAGERFPLDGELTVGRAPGCQINLASDTFVSQLHARVFARDGQLFVEDLGSTNGTYLNNRKVESPVAIHRGDHLQVGKTVLEVR